MNLWDGLLGNKALVFIGFISYPLYLIHENMMVEMIVKVGWAFPGMPAILIPALPICVVISLAWVIAKYMEPATKAFLDVRSSVNRRQSHLVS
jgi:peptidoglycan/LPS O-acetylase OafA/YrhL